MNLYESIKKNLKEDEEFVGHKNKYNITQEQLKINHKDKTFKRGDFKWLGKDEVTNKKKYDAKIEDLTSKGYKEIKDGEELKEGATWGGHSIEYSLEDIKKQLDLICDEYIKDVEKYKQLDINTYDMEALALPSIQAKFDDLASKYFDTDLDEKAIKEVVAYLLKIKESGIVTDGMVEEDKEALLNYAIKNTDFDYVYDEDYDTYIDKLYSLGQRGWVPGKVEKQLINLRPDTYWEVAHKAGLNVDEWYTEEDEEETEE